MEQQADYLEELVADCYDLLATFLSMQALDYAVRCQPSWLESYPEDIVSVHRQRCMNFIDQYQHSIQQNSRFLSQTFR